MTQFSDLSLDPKVLKAIDDAGYKEPTPIQAQGIPPALEGRDVLGIAQTGTGKTASFVLPMITRLGRGRARARMPRSLVLAPTRELAAQVAENFDIYAKYTKLTKALLIGGVSFSEQDKLIDRGVDVLIATPGRLLDHFERGKLLLTGVQILVVDEADRMLDMGFIPDIERIFQLTPFTRQTLFFSATMAPEIERITNTFLTAPARIEVARQATASLTIDQGLVRFKPARKDQTFAEKRAILRALIRSEGEACTNAIVFCNRKVDVDVVAKSLKQHGFDAAPIHGDLDQSVRTRTLDGFRDGSIRLLIASDVAARGLDVPSVSHVFNFDVPSHPEDYIHRIGRTGRAGRKGKAITIAGPADDKYLAAIHDLIKIDIPEMENPVAARAPRSPDEFEAAEAGRDEKPKRSRTRGGRGRAKTAATGSETATADTDAARTATTDAETGAGQAATDEAQAAAAHAAPAEADERTASVEATDSDKPGGEPRRGQRRERGGREHGEGRRNDPDIRRDNRVVGMGDHVPDFLLRSFHMAGES